MIDQVKRLWQASQPSETLCPGEPDCPDFAAAGGEGITYEEQCHACLTCPKKESKLKANRRDLLERFALRIQYLARCRDSGYPVGVGEMTAFEMAALFLWDDEMAFYARSLQMAGMKFNL